MHRTCPQCSAEFEVTAADRAILDKMTPEFNGKKFPIPDPTLCFDCRLQRRLAFFNGKTLYQRECDFSKKPIISIFSPDKPYKVFDRDIWYSDEWDPLEYGQDFDFNQTFFEQFGEFMKQVPILSLSILGNNINSNYTNDNFNLKNCYLVFNGEQAEDAYYGSDFIKIKDCLDFYGLAQSEVCYECLHCQESYNLRHSQFCKNCHDSWFLRDCIGCKNCFGCANLRQKEYCIFNQQKSKDEYEKFLQEFNSRSFSKTTAVKNQVEEFFKTQPVKAVRGEQNLECMGDNLNNSKNAYYCFDSNNLHDARYCTDCLVGAKDTMDVHIWGDGLELSYNCTVAGANSRNLLCGYYVSQGCDQVYYSMYCSRSSKNLFGCIGLRHQQYCIFNKQYKPAEYADLMEKIITHMQATGEWGEFFPPQISAFGYNETMASAFFPLEKEAVLNQGWQWSDYQSPMQADRVIEVSQLPDDSNDVPDDVLNWAIKCQVTSQPFKIVKQELDFYRLHQLPIPRHHPDQRHLDRFAYKNPYKLWQRDCAKCQQKMWSSYAPERPEIVYCEDCYLGEVY